MSPLAFAAFKSFSFFAICFSLDSCCRGDGCGICLRISAYRSAEMSPLAFAAFKSFSFFAICFSLDSCCFGDSIVVRCCDAFNCFCTARRAACIFSNFFVASSNFLAVLSFVAAACTKESERDVIFWKRSRVIEMSFSYR